MKLTLAVLVLTLSTSAFAANKVYKIDQYNDNDKVVKKTVTISEKRFSTRDEASKFCKSQKSSIADLSVVFGIGDKITEEEGEQYFGFDFSHLQGEDAYPKATGLMMWSEDAVYKNSKSESNKKAEIISMINGQGEQVDLLTASDVNKFLTKMGGKNIRLPAICIK